MSGSHPVEFATVLVGATAFKEGNISDTYRGRILRSDNSVALAILKDVPAKELANELISFVLARSLSLPVPDVYIAIVKNGDLNVSNGPITEDGERLVLASVDVQTPSIMFRYLADVPGQHALLETIAKWHDLGRLYGFDAWIANTDRNPGNLLFGPDMTMWLIDHGFAFSRPNWIEADLMSGFEFGSKLAGWLTPSLTEKLKTTHAGLARQFQMELKKLNIDNAVDESKAGLLLTLAEINAVKLFLRDRIKEVGRFASNALDVAVLA